jgi:hypothetical protein
MTSKNITFLSFATIDRSASTITMSLPDLENKTMEMCLKWAPRVKISQYWGKEIIYLKYELRIWF